MPTPPRSALNLSKRGYGRVEASWATRRRGHGFLARAIRDLVGIRALRLFDTDPAASATALDQADRDPALRKSCRSGPAAAPVAALCVTSAAEAPGRRRWASDFAETAAPGTPAHWSRRCVARTRADFLGLARIFHEHLVGGLVPKRVFIGI